MSVKELQRFLKMPLIARIATNNKNGYPNVSPVWFLYKDGAILIDAYTNSQKVKNILRDDRVSVLIDTSDEGLRVKGLSIKGRAKLSGGDEATEIEKSIFRKYLSNRSRAGDSVSRYYMKSAGANPAEITIIKVTPERVSSWDYTGVTIADLSAQESRLVTRHNPRGLNPIGP